MYGLLLKEVSGRNYLETNKFRKRDKKRYLLFIIEPIAIITLIVFHVILHNK